MTKKSKATEVCILKSALAASIILASSLRVRANSFFHATIRAVVMGKEKGGKGEEKEEEEKMEGRRQRTYEVVEKVN